MSVNTNRKKLDKATCPKDYKVIWLRYEFPMYWEYSNSKRGGIDSFKFREYRSWKYNRKTQWK